MVLSKKNKGIFAIVALCASFHSHGVSISGNNVVTISGYDPYVYVSDHATVNLVGSSDVSFLDTYDQSHANIYDGQLSWLNMYNQSTADIHKTDISWLLMGGGSSATIYGSNFSYSGGHLSGNWLDGTQFSFWALNIYDNGQIVTPNPVSMPSNITLSSVPVPAAAWLLGSGLLGLSGVARRKAV